jgi:hypothetical protein
MDNLKEKSLKEIAQIILRDWSNVYFGAVPYLQVMAIMQTINDSYGYDDGHSIVTYFLSNAKGWKGDVAREVKKELNRRLTVQSS